MCKLNNALYRLKQAPRLWHAKIDRYLDNLLHFRSSPNDQCLYIRHTGDRILLVRLNVDDLVISARNRSDISCMKGELSPHFDMEDLEEATVCLGQRSNGIGPIAYFISVSQDTSQ